MLLGEEVAWKCIQNFANDVTSEGSNLGIQDDWVRSNTGAVTHQRQAESDIVQIVQAETKTSMLTLPRPCLPGAHAKNVFCGACFDTSGRSCILCWHYIFLADAPNPCNNCIISKPRNQCSDSAGSYPKHRCNSKPIYPLCKPSVCANHFRSRTNGSQTKTHRVCWHCSLLVVDFMIVSDIAVCQDCARVMQITIYARHGGPKVGQCGACGENDADKYSERGMSLCTRCFFKRNFCSRCHDFSAGCTLDPCECCIQALPGICSSNASGFPQYRCRNPAVWPLKYPSVCDKHFSANNELLPKNTGYLVCYKCSDFALGCTLVDGVQLCVACAH